MRSATLEELAARFGCQLVGSGRAVVRRVATLTGAGADAITFLANPRYREQLAGTRAAGVVLERSFAAACPVPCLISANPYATYARIAAYLHAPPALPPGVHPTASIAAAVAVPGSVHIGAGAVIGAGCELGPAAVIGAGCVLGANVRVGADTRLAARVTLLDDVTIGARCIIHPGAVVGADGFGFAEENGEWIKIPQLGTVVIGNDVEIGANSTIDRGAIDATTIEDGVKLDNLVQIAHNVRIGAHTAIAALCGIAGSTKIGRRCKIGGGVIIANQLTICDDVMLLFGSVVIRSIEAAGVYGGGIPADEAGRWRRNAVRFLNLDTMAERLRSVEDALAADAASRKDRNHD